MDEELKNLESYSKKVSWASVVLAFLSGIIGFLKFSESYSQYAISGSIFLAFVSGFSGLIAKFVQKRQEELQEEFKKTKPNMDVYLAKGIEDGKIYVVVEPKNKIPFDLDFKVCTRKNIVVSSIFLERPKVYPNDKLKKFLYSADINFQRIIDDYIELRFNFRSVYAAEFPKKDLSGKIVKQQRASDLLR